LSWRCWQECWKWCFKHVARFWQAHRRMIPLEVWLPVSRRTATHGALLRYGALASLHLRAWAEHKHGSPSSRPSISMAGWAPIRWERVRHAFLRPTTNGCTDNNKPAAHVWRCRQQSVRVPEPGKTTTI
jgi:hypothetical protein